MKGPKSKQMDKQPLAVTVKEEALAASSSLITQSRGFEEITTPEAYVQASLVRAQVQQLKKTWTDKLQKIINPAYEALQGLYSLKKDILGPMEKAEVGLTSAMRDFKLSEARQIQEAEERKRQEEERLRVEVERKEIAAERAATPQMRGRIEAQVEKVKEKLAQTEAQETITEVRAVGSTTRKVKKWRCVNITLLAKAVAKGEVPDDVLSVNSVRMNEYFRSSPKDVGMIPGIEVYDDVIIVGR